MLKLINIGKANNYNLFYYRIYYVVCIYILCCFIIGYNLFVYCIFVVIGNLKTNKLSTMFIVS